jgi:hypothetical protein
MNIEGLTKTQIVLLTLLVSFMTSIATGIVTVSLISQAPPVVTQTVNRVVERTVERVSPDRGQTASAAQQPGSVVREVIIKESDLITDAIARNSESLVRIYTANPGGSDIRGTFLGVGFILSNDGLVVTDATLVEPSVLYAVEVMKGSVYEARLKNESPSRPTAILSLARGEGDATVFRPVAFSNLAASKLGERVVTLMGKDRTVVGEGIISEIVYMGSAAAEEKQNITSFVTSIPSEKAAPGAPLVDLLGEVLGIYLTGGGQAGGIVYVSNVGIKAQLEEVLETQSATSTSN